MQIFISYAHDDEYLVKTLIVDLLEAAGHRPWFDHHLVVGQDWKAQLAKQINQCDAFLYAISPVSIESEWCRWEFKQAVEENKPVIPVLLRKTQLPNELSRIQFVDFSKGAEALSVARLLGGIQQLQINQVPAVPEQPSGIPTTLVPTLSEDETRYTLRVHLVIGKIFYDHASPYVLEIDGREVWSGSILSFDGMIYEKEYPPGSYRISFRTTFQAEKRKDVVIDLRSDRLISVNVKKNWLDGSETIQIN